MTEKELKTELETEPIIERELEEIAPEDDYKSKKKDKKKDKRQEETDELKRLVNESTDRYLRTMAEFDNFRKRTAKEKTAMYDDGVTAAILKFLPVIDNFERAMTAVCDDDPAIKGFAMILRQMKDILSGMGAAEIDPVGKPFNPNLHEAVMVVETDAFEPGTVVEELMKGYIYKDKPIRHSMVKVAQ